MISKSGKAGAAIARGQAGGRASAKQMALWRRLSVETGLAFDEEWAKFVASDRSVASEQIDQMLRLDAR